MSEKGDGWTGTEAARVPAALTRGVAPPRSRISECVAMVWHWTALISHHHSLGITFIEKVKSIIIKKEKTKQKSKTWRKSQARENGFGGRGSCAPTSPSILAASLARSVRTPWPLGQGACLSSREAQTQGQGWLSSSVHAGSSEEFHQVLEVWVNKVGGQIAIIVGCIPVCSQRDEIPGV